VATAGPGTKLAALCDTPASQRRPAAMLKSSGQDFCAVLRINKMLSLNQWMSACFRKFSSRLGADALLRLVTKLPTTQQF